MSDKIYTGINLAQYLGVAIQPDTIFRWIQLGLAILCSLVILLRNISNWYKEAKKDNKITKEEIKELIENNKDIAIEVITQTTNLIDEIKENGELHDEDHKDR